MIPFIVHQTWKSKSLSEPVRSYCDSWKRLNPSCDYRFYDDADCLALVRTDYPRLIDLYESLPLSILRADLFRYLAVYRFGGIYADVDMECLQPFDSFLSAGGAVFSIEAQTTSVRQRELQYREPFQIANCIFASEAGHPFIRLIIDRAVQLISLQPSIKPDAVEDVTGPRMLTRLFYETTPPAVRVLQQIYWLPYRIYPRAFPFNINMYARHHFIGSWKDRSGHTPSLRRIWIERDRMPNPFPRTRFHEFNGK